MKRAISWSMPASPATTPPLSRHASLASLQPITLILPHEGSTARDQLGIERTFLSWLRLSLALLAVGLFMILGLRIENNQIQNITLSHEQKQAQTALGVIVIVATMITLAANTRSYLKTQHRMSMTKEWLWKRKPRIRMDMDEIMVEDETGVGEDNQGMVRMVKVWTPSRAMFFGLFALIVVMTMVAMILDMVVPQ